MEQSKIIDTLETYQPAAVSFTSPGGGDANLHLQVLYFTSGGGNVFFLHLHHLLEVGFWASKMYKLVIFASTSSIGDALSMTKAAYIRMQ
jgi:hypothetical protein